MYYVLLLYSGECLAMLKGHGVGGWVGVIMKGHPIVEKFQNLWAKLSVGSSKGINMESVFVRHITGCLTEVEL